MSGNIATVKAIYGCFARGDVAGIHGLEAHLWAFGADGLVTRSCRLVATRRGTS